MYTALFIILSFLIYYIVNKLKTPKFIKNKKIYPVGNFDNLDKNRYSKRKIPDNIDVIIIGSGISGLVCGALLSKCSKKVLVLEQHYIAGGNLHTFEETKIEHDTGLHYIGLSKTLKTILNLLTENLSWYQLGSKSDLTYDEIHFGKDIYKLRSGLNNVINDLSTKFPNEKENIVRYFNLVQKVAKINYFEYKIISNDFIYKNLMKLLLYFDNDYNKYLSNNTYDVIKSIINDEKLVDVLCGQCGDYGISPKESNFYIHANVVNHYLNGGYYPNGGTSNISKQLIKTINQNGGTVLVNKKVNNILTKKNIAYGVEMENHDIIYADKIVSSIGFKNTFTHLVKNKYYDNFLYDIKSSKSFLTLFVNLNNSIENFDIPDYNIWHYPSYNIDKCINNFNKNITDNKIPFFLSSSSAKDNTWKDRYPNKSNVSIICIVDNNLFELWRDQKSRKRDVHYKNLKEILSKKILNECLFELFPKTKNNIIDYQLGTPETFRYYLNTFDGEGYGLESSKERFLNLDLKPKSKVKNLYLTGQDICTMGISGALFSGVLTSYSILEYGNIIDILLKRDLIKDLIK